MIQETGRRRVTRTRGAPRRARSEIRLTRGGSVGVVIALLVGVLPIARAQDAPADGVAKVAEEVRAPVDPYEAVHEGNRLLKDDKPAEALKLYRRAEEEKPDAREIAYAEGLSRYHLGDYERARDLFRKAAAGKNDALADDATYSLGTTYHSDALRNTDDPKASMADLERAMEHYQTVLSHDPNHPAARDAYRKAGAFWRKIKQQQQQQQQSSSDNKDDKDQKKDDQQQDKKQQQQKQPGEQQQDSDKQESSAQQKDQDSQPQDKNDKQPKASESKQDEPQESESKDQDRPQEQKQSTAEQKEQVSREQAQRKLREMMQSLRERKEKRRQPTRVISVRPVDKDW